MDHRLFFLCVAFIGMTPFVCRADFDLEHWKANRGQRKDLKKWQKENPGPWRSYFDSSSEDCGRRWYINLGPLGVRTLMHDRTWGVFPASRAAFPEVLSDDEGLIWNAFEVLGVKKGSPAEGSLQEGDLILAIDGVKLRSAQHTYVGQPMDNRTKRGLEIHAGQLIDRAEGRGEITLTVLRLPGAGMNRKLNQGRNWRETARVKSKGTLELSVPIKGENIIRIRPAGKRGVKSEALTLLGKDGKKIPIEITQKRGAGKLIGDPLEIPAGEWMLEGSIKSNRAFELIVETAELPETPQSLVKHIKKINLKLDPIGSFGDRFDPDGEKARNYSDILAHRLAAQQEKDGSWHAGGYASRAFHSSMCGLALLSTGNPAYDDAIRRAAYYVGTHGDADKWSYSNGTWLIFLAEYYLRTGDEGILPAMRLQVRNLRRFVLSDYTAGHSYAKPGYGGGGWIGGGGVISCGLAVASHTPAMKEDDLALLDRMLARAQELAPHGRIQYGRGGKVKSDDAAPGQGGSCATGPYFIASLVRGGAEQFTGNCIKRYSSEPFGSAENGHATQTLHFVWGCLSVANTSAEAHRAHMDAYLWKFTTLREFDGFINKNNYRTEYHNGDGVIGEPYWRTAGYLLVMNAHKRNLAITGHPDYRSAIRPMPLVYHRDRAAHNQVLRNWDLVESALPRRESPAVIYRCGQSNQVIESRPGAGDKSPGHAVRCRAARSGGFALAD